ncbi:DinB superfamily protein [Seonamhaeicola sp. S2-3]|uniref:DinB family protein n=1 Tax=Seonamhaeicola sp. S2-3 TaxID=1936081 RepID=UPI00097290A7|nr:DinB family protein [Seonamhaeicola sp. S2-3]APY09898.1 DinB superfamily protein [Seonamhaeicola sp. S2-3]
MLAETLIKIITRDLNNLKVEINAYKNENNLWIIKKGIKNTAGNLCLHLVGNLNHFIGNVLGNTGYIRERDLEFSIKGISKKELINQIEETIIMVEKVLKNLNEESFKEQYPIKVFKNNMTVQHFLIHLSTHLAYHLGQVNYHRRLLDL